MMKDTLMLMLLLLLPVAAIPQAGDIISKAIAAVGGDRYLNNKTLVVLGETQADLPIVGKRKTQFTIYTMGKLYRKEEVSAGEKGVIGFDGKEYWLVHNNQKTEVPNAVIRSLRNQHKIELTTLADAAKTGIQLKFLGNKQVDGIDMALVEARYQDGDLKTFYFDRNSFLLQRVEQTESSGFSGTQIRKTIFKDYREVDGLKFPFLKQVFVDSKMVQEQRLTEVKTGVNLPNDLFTKP